MTVATRRSIALFALLVTPAVSLSQPAGKPSDDPIPRELALALLNLTPAPGWGVQTDIRVGKAPDDVPPELVPPGLQVLGSMTKYESSSIILIASQQPDSAIAALEAHLLSVGWTRPPVPTYRPPRGFVAADVALASPDRPDMVCRGDEFAMLSGTYRRSGGSLIKVMYNRGQQFSACKNREQPTQYRSPYEEAPVPTLRAPSGSMARGSSDMTMGGSSSSIALSTRLATRLKVGEVVDHYDKQMRDQGWAPLKAGTVEFLGARTYRKNDEKGRTWNALLLSLSIADNNEQDVSLRLTQRQ